MTPNHRERQIMQRLRGNGWIKASMIPDSPKTLQRLLAKGWIETQGVGTELTFRITEKGLAAKKMPIKLS
jgi:DNA-binding PadR family transcriptional regulator